MSLDVEIRAAERAGDEALVRRLRRRRGDARIFVGDRVKCMRFVFGDHRMVGQTGEVQEVRPTLIRVRYLEDPLLASDYGWWCLHSEIELWEE